MLTEQLIKQIVPIPNSAPKQYVVCLIRRFKTYIHVWIADTLSDRKDYSIVCNQMLALLCDLKWSIMYLTRVKFDLFKNCQEHSRNNGFLIAGISFLLAISCAQSIECISMLMENIRFNVYNLQRWFVRTLICSDEFEPPPWFYDVYEPEKLIPQIHTEHQIENRLRKKPSKFVSTPLFHFIGDRGMFFSMFFFFSVLGSPTEKKSQRRI